SHELRNLKCTGLKKCGARLSLKFADEFQGRDAIRARGLNDLPASLTKLSLARRPSSLRCACNSARKAGDLRRSGIDAREIGDLHFCSFAVFCGSIPIQSIQTPISH